MSLLATGILVFLFVAGSGRGLLGLVYFDRMILQSARRGGDVSGRQLALMIAAGIGLPNFSEGLALAAGSILYVVRELLHVGRRFQLPELATWGVFLGLVAGYGTDLVLTWAGV
jgi:zinc transporter ZupT